MADRVEAFLVTIPAGVAQATPVTIAMPFPDGIVQELDITVPPGPCGNMGFAVSYGGQIIIPRSTGQFIVADDRVFNWPIHNHPTGGKWQIVGYNTDVYQHSLHVEFQVDELPAPAPAAFTLVPIE